MNWSWGLRSMLPIFRPFFHQIKASKCNFVSFLKVRAFSDFHSLLCFLLLFPQSRFFDSLSAECFQCIAMVGQWDAGTAQKNRFVLFLDSASVTIYPPHHLPQGTGFSDNNLWFCCLFVHRGRSVWAALDDLFSMLDFPGCSWVKPPVTAWLTSATTLLMPQLPPSLRSCGHAAYVVWACRASAGVPL